MIFKNDSEMNNQTNTNSLENEWICIVRRISQSISINQRSMPTIFVVYKRAFRFHCWRNVCFHLQMDSITDSRTKVTLNRIHTNMNNDEGMKKTIRIPPVTSSKLCLRKVQSTGLGFRRRTNDSWFKWNLMWWILLFFPISKNFFFSCSNMFWVLEKKPFRFVSYFDNDIYRCKSFDIAVCGLYQWFISNKFLSIGVIFRI